MQTAFWNMRDVVEGSFTFDLELKSSYPVDAVRMPNQPGAVLTQIEQGHWTVRLGASASRAADIDEQIAAIEGGESIPVADDVRPIPVSVWAVCRYTNRILTSWLARTG